MINIELLRNNYDEVCEKLSSRHKKYEALEEFKQVDASWRKIMNEIQKLKTEYNQLSKKASLLFLKNKQAGKKKITSDLQKLKNEINKLNSEKIKIDEQFKNILLNIPNIPNQDVPLGENEFQNQEVRKWSEPTNFKFNPLPHWEIGRNLNILDDNKGSKESGSRFNIYLNDGAKLIRVLQDFTLEMNKQAGFKEVLPPVILKPETLYGTGQLPKFEEDLFKLTINKFLSPTAEVQLTNLYSGEIINEKLLPIYLTASTACFRSEAGAAGKDERGVVRQHQFYKTEMVMLTKQDDSYHHLEFMVKCAENILQKLNLPYRTIILCTGDMGFASAKTYDIEVWLPSYKGYKEISSCSNCESFQSRNLLIRYRSSNNDKTKYVHTLNGSGLAIDRLWAAIVENYQQLDGSIKVPDALKPYFNKEFITKDAK